MRFEDFSCLHLPIVMHGDIMEYLHAIDTPEAIELAAELRLGL